MANLRVFGHFKLYKGGGGTYTGEYRAIVQGRGGDLYRAIVQKRGGDLPGAHAIVQKGPRGVGTPPSFNTGVIPQAIVDDKLPTQPKGKRGRPHTTR